MVSRRFSSLILPIVLLAALIAFTAFTQNVLAALRLDAAVNPDLVRRGAMIAVAVASAWLMSRLVDVVVWRRVELRTAHVAPKLLVAVIRMLIACVALGAILAICQQPVTGVIVSSSAVGVIIGFALQRMISDFFSGIALTMEQPLRIGDWIELDGVAGRVVETNWRATRFLTQDQVTIIVPNSFIGERRLSNYSLPLPQFRAEIPVVLEYAVHPADAKRMLLAAVKSTQGVLDQPPPDVLVKAFDRDGIAYRVRFFVPSFAERDAAVDRVAVSIERHLFQAGVSIPYQKIDVHHAPMPARNLDRKSNRDALLSRVELFDGLGTHEIAQLAGALVERPVRAGQKVVRQGEQGESLFVVVEGLLEVSLQDNGTTRAVGRIGPGEFFGEMSLLTGAPRGATVTAATDAVLFELTRAVISPVLEARPEIVESISEVVAQRRLRNDQLSLVAQVETQAAQARSLADEIRRRIRGFFRMKQPSARENALK